MNENFIDYYAVLGLSIFAQDNEIKKQFHILAQKWHPDHNTAPEASDKFREIYAAYEVLSHSEKKQEYDDKYQAWQKEKVKTKKEKMMFWLGRILVLVSSLIVAGLSFYLLKAKNINLGENIIFSLLISYLTYYLFILLIYDFHKFYPLVNQSLIWKIHSILTINAVFLVICQIFLWNEVVFESPTTLLILCFAIVFILKIILFSQESFLQLKKKNFYFLGKNVLNILITGLFSFLNGVIIALVFFKFMNLNVNSDLIWYLGTFSALEVIIFSAFAH